MPLHFGSSAACSLIVIVMTGCASAPAVTSASGQVLDVHSRPVAGARVTLKSHAKLPIGTGLTDLEGHFAFAITRHRGGEPELSVDAEGFMYWSRWAGWEQLADYPVQLDRRADAAYLTALRAVSDPAERVSRMEEVLSVEVWNFAVEPLFPFLGELRQDLIAASARPTRTVTGDLLADRAFELLAFWGDPSDGALLAPWLAKNTWFAAAPSPVRAPNLDDMCQAWAAVHFGHEGLKGRWPPYYCTESVIDPGQTRALMLFQVDYTHWRYNMHLVLGRDSKDQPWQLRAVAEGMTDDLIE
jgi:hypothetical protein